MDSTNAMGQAVANRSIHCATQPGANPEGRAVKVPVIRKAIMQEMNT